MAATQPKALGRPPGVKGEDRRQHLLEITIELLAEKGYTATTVSDVAERAGITSGAVYYYFPSKRHLVEAAYEEHMRAIADTFRASVAGLPTLKDQLSRILEDAIRLNRQAPQHARLAVHMLTDALHHPELSPLFRRATIFDGLLSELCVAAEERGELASGRSASDVTRMLIAALRGLGVYGTYADPEDHASAVRCFGDLLREGL